MAENYETHENMEEALEADKIAEEKKLEHRPGAKVRVPAKGKASKPRAGRGKDLSAEEFAKELDVTPRALRVILRQKYTAGYKRWVITPQMQKEIKAQLAKTKK